MPFVVNRSYDGKSEGSGSALLPRPGIDFCPAFSRPESDESLPETVAW